MSSATVEAIIRPLVQRQIFPTPVEAARTLVQDYAGRQVARHERAIARFEKQYSMNWHQFTQYTTERTATLRRADFSTEQRQTLSQTIMREEDDWLAWKAAVEMRRSWLDVLAEEASLSQ
jgi:hypothetical protein